MINSLHPLQFIPGIMHTIQAYLISGDIKKADDPSQFTNSDRFLCLFVRKVADVIVLLRCLSSIYPSFVIFPM